MGGGVDPARHVGNDDVILASEIGGKRAGEAPAAERGVARADHGDGFAREQGCVAEEREQRRRVLDVREQRRIRGLAEGDEGAAEPGDFFHFRFGLGRRANGGRRPAAPAREFGQARERLGGRAEPFDQAKKSHRADPLRADQPEPVPFFRLR